MTGRAGRAAAAACGRQVERQHEAADLALGLGDLGGAHRLEIHALQAFALADTVSTASITGGSSSARGFGSRGGHRFGDAAAAGRRALRALAPSAPRAAPSRPPAGRASGSRQNSVEGLVEHILHARADAPSRLRSAARASVRLPRSTSASARWRRQRLGRADRQAGAAQQVREMHDVGGERSRIAPCSRGRLLRLGHQPRCLGAADAWRCRPDISAARRASHRPLPGASSCWFR